MKKLDRLDWAEGLTLSAFGVRTGLRVNLPGVLPQVLPLLPPGWKKCRSVSVKRLYSLVVAQGRERAGMRRLHVLYADSMRVARGAALAQVLAAFETDLHRYTAEATSDMTLTCDCAPRPQFQWQNDTSPRDAAPRRNVLFR